MSTHTTGSYRPTTWTALVLTTDSAHFAGRVLRRTVDYVPPGLTADPVQLLNQVSAMFDGEGTLIVPQVPGPYYDTSWTTLTYPEQLRECAKLAAAGGWSTTDTAADHEYGWVTFKRMGKPEVHIGILPHIKIEADQIIDPIAAPETMADLLARYRAAVGVAWRSTAGVAGVQMIRAEFDRPVRTKTGTRRRDQPLWIETTDRVMTGAGDIMWSRSLTADEKKDLVVVQFDITMAYGAAAGMAELPVNQLTQTGACEFDPLAGGYWRVRIPKGAWWARNALGKPPVVNVGRILGDRTVWLTTPLMILLDELHVQPEIIDSMTTDRTDRLLRPWYERLRDARVAVPSADSERLAKAIKATANSAIGMMHSGRGRIQRRVWADTIIDLARANLYRKIRDASAEIGWPFRVEHDSCWYTISESASARTFPDATTLLKRYATALKAGPQMGRFREEKTWTMGEYQATRRLANRRKEY